MLPLANICQAEPSLPVANTPGFYHFGRGYTRPRIHSATAGEISAGKCRYQTPLIKSLLGVLYATLPAQRAASPPFVASRFLLYQRLQTTGTPLPLTEGLGTGAIGSERCQLCGTLEPPLSYKPLLFPSVIRTNKAAGLTLPYTATSTSQYPATHLLSAILFFNFKFIKIPLIPRDIWGSGV